MSSSTATSPIRSFTGVYRFLSNFYPAEVELDGLTYPTVEHAFQAAKVEDLLILRTTILYAPTPGEAKKLGQLLHLRPDWEEIKLQVMENLLRQKFVRLRPELVETWPRELIEGNNWGDTFWGVCNSKGQNHLGKLLMKIREELRMPDTERIDSPELYLRMAQRHMRNAALELGEAFRYADEELQEFVDDSNKHLSEAATQLSLALDQLRKRSRPTMPPSESTNDPGGMGDTTN